MYAVKSRLGQRIQDLEEELKRVREDAECAAKASKSDDEVSIIYVTFYLEALNPLFLRNDWFMVHSVLHFFWVFLL